MLHRFLERELQSVVSSLFPEADRSALLVRPCADPRFGDYQTNGLMSLAKERKENPRQIAAAVLDKLEVSRWCTKIEIAGAGFLNFHLKPEAVAEALAKEFHGGVGLIEKAPAPRTIVVDFSGPNVAKAMHVGHIRSTILGDCLVRTLRLLGHRVIGDNHIGDWGTQFGMLLVGWKQELDPDLLAKDPIAEMERLYKKVNAACQGDPAIREQARSELVKLQNGDPENLAIWERMISLSRSQFEAIYARLGVKFDAELGESFYNPRLKPLIETLHQAGIAQESEGAIAVFFPDIPALKDQPALIRKSDGAANYTTTDLATMAYRLETWQPDEIIYVTDARQQLHFQQVFAIFRRWHPEAKVKLSHVTFGSILGEDGKPYKTRSGETVKLTDLLDEAEERAFAVVSEKSPDLPPETRREIARIVGTGAVKYADLLPNRQSDYVFSWSKMLALTGNTAPYLLYAYARIRSIFRKEGGTFSPENSDAPVSLRAPEELAIAKHLLKFGLTLEAVTEDYRPNYLCNYLYDLAGLFARFYENCPVLRSEGAERFSRLALCDLTGRVLKQGLGALGIETIEQM